jgi:CelD/BcsL family acetyltransferase involved in cellulose biosynthesis
VNTAVAGSELTVSVLDGFEAFMALESEWRALHAAAAHPHTCLRHSWLRLCWTLVRQRFPNRLKTVLVREAGELVMAGAFVLGLRGVTPVLRFLTSGMPQCEDVLWRRTPRSTEHAALLIAALRRNLIPHRLRFEQMPHDSPFYAALAAAPLRRRRRAEKPISYLTMADHAGYEGYLASLSHKLRDDHRRRLRRLAERDDFSIRLEEGAEQAATLAWMFNRKRLWLDEKQRTAGWLTNGLIDRFLPALLASGDAPETWILTLRIGTIAAAALVLIERDVAIFSHFAFDPAFGKQSPGRTLALRLIEMCFERGFRELDMGQITPWKHRLQPKFRELVSERAWL